MADNDTNVTRIGDILARCPVCCGRVSMAALEEIAGLLDAAERERDELRAAQQWQPIETAPKDGTEILAFRDDCGVMMAKWSSAAEFLTDRELEQWDEDAANQEDWFSADFVTGDRLDGDLTPTHWQPLPDPPQPR